MSAPISRSTPVLSRTFPPLAAPTLLMLALLALCCPSTVHAEIYKCTDAAGRLSFSDKPCPRNTVASEVYTETADDKQATAAEKLEATTYSAPDKATVYLAKGGKVVLKTASMQSSRGLTWHLTNDLVLPNGVRVPYKKVSEIIILKGSSSKQVNLKIIMRNGQESIETIDAPITYVSGETRLGKFNKKLHEIKRIRFD